MFKKIIFCLFISVISVSCEYFKQPETQDAIARVNETYLYKDDIKKILPENYTKQDSTVIVNNYINNWATEQLLVKGATLNLDENTQEEFNQLVKQYQNDLYSKAYLEALVYKNLDTTVSVEEATKYYNENKQAFKLNEDLIKFRYINIDENRLDFDEVKQKFKRFNNKDKRELDSIAIQFKSYSLNDSVWIRLDQVITKIPTVNTDNKNELLKKSNFIQSKDSLGLYLMQIN
ncbi:MAG: peptidyl-prolyl cis-trans isomerase, partial [Lacinutrix venerupis]